MIASHGGKDRSHCLAVAPDESVIIKRVGERHKLIEVSTQSINLIIA